MLEGLNHLHFDTLCFLVGGFIVKPYYDNFVFMSTNFCFSGPDKTIFAVI
jgi:hypothetical protein